MPPHHHFGQSFAQTCAEHGRSNDIAYTVRLALFCAHLRLVGNCKPLGEETVTGPINLLAFLKDYPSRDSSFVMPLWYPVGKVRMGQNAANHTTLPHPQSSIPPQPLSTIPKNLSTFPNTTLDEASPPHFYTSGISQIKQQNPKQERRLKSDPDNGNQ